MKIKALLTGCFLLLLTACSDPLPTHKRNYAGEWESPEMYLLITADGRVAYERKKSGGNVSVEGPITEFIGDDFEVGVLFITTRFEVSQPPAQHDDGRWTMVVDGVTLTRY